MKLYMDTVSDASDAGYKGEWAIAPPLTASMEKYEEKISEKTKSSLKIYQSPLVLRKS